MSSRADPVLRLTVYDAGPGSHGVGLFGPARWFVYAPSGELTVEIDSTARTVAPDDGLFVERPSRLTGAAEAWVYEVASASAPFLTGAEIVRSQVLRPPFGWPRLLRADRIESPPGAVTPRHGHRGPGMRRLIYGRLLAEIGDTVERIEAGHAWFEAGTDMVVGTNTGGGNAAFVRVMLLPIEFEGGKSSFIAANDIEAAKPRAVSSRLFGEINLTGIAADERA